MSVLQVSAPDTDGDLFARPLEWQGTGPEPRILLLARAATRHLAKVIAFWPASPRSRARITPTRRASSAVSAPIPNAFLVCFARVRTAAASCRSTKAAPVNGRCPMAQPTEPRMESWSRENGSGPNRASACRRPGLSRGLAIPRHRKRVSLIAIHEHGIPTAFPTRPSPKPMPPRRGPGRQDRPAALPLVTIDPADARDHDDACFAEPDPDPKNEGGHILWVAIADVAHYVRPGQNWTAKRESAAIPPIFLIAWCRCCPNGCRAIFVLCTKAFPAPVLLCAWCWIQREKNRHEFHRGLMKSWATLHYTEVQAAMDGACPNELSPLMDGLSDRSTPPTTRFESPRSAPAAGTGFARAQDHPQRRGQGDLGGPQRPSGRPQTDRRIHGAGQCRSCGDPGFQAHTASFRVHEEPSPEKLDALRDTAAGRGIHARQRAGSENPASQSACWPRPQAPTMPSF